jgi:hypothetical protein
MEGVAFALLELSGLPAVTCMAFHIAQHRECPVASNVRAVEGLLARVRTEVDVEC